MFTFPAQSLFTLPTKVYIVMLAFLEISLIESLNCPLLDIIVPK